MGRIQTSSSRKLRFQKESGHELGFSRNGQNAARKPLPKSPTGIQGFDEITGGGLPKGRPTLICGSAGCGKTLFALEFLVRGATQYNEPGVFIAFEETAEDLTKNVASLGFDLPRLIARRKLAIDYVQVERSEIEETGEYDLEGLFIRLDYAIRSVKAKRVVLDTIESLFSGLSNLAILRAELRRLFRWLKERGVTALITGERGENGLTRQGLEEYVSDCVILLDHRVDEQRSTRRLRIVKYRGSTHGTNEYPFLIDEDGFSVVPITSLGLKHSVSTQRISTGIPRLDTMLSGKGLYRGSTVLVSGTAGTGKSSLAAHLALASCQRGERVLYFAFEESADQIQRNMQSIGLDLRPWVRKGLLQFQNSRPSLQGLEMHLVGMHRHMRSFQPRMVIVDPITNLMQVGHDMEVQGMLTRLVDFLKMHQITALFTALTHSGWPLEQSVVAISSLVDTWLLLRDIELNGERNRALYVLKSRGMAHSNQIREFVLTSRGVQLLDVYLGPAGVLTGSSRAAQEARERAESADRQGEIDLHVRQLDRKRQVMESQVAQLRAEFEAEELETKKHIDQARSREHELSQDRRHMAAARKADQLHKQGNA